MKKIIVNADDFGLNDLVNREIEQCIEDNIISSTTIMANGKSLDEALCFAKDHPNASYGIHLCLSEFNSVTRSPILRDYGIIDSDGVYIRQHIFKIKHFSKELKEAIKEELRAQIQIIKSYGIPLSHCDSHHHVHTIYGLQRIFRDVISEAGFTRIRIPRSVDTYSLFRYPIVSQKRLFVTRYYKAYFKTVDIFSSYSEYLKMPQHKKDGYFELMCHPGHKDFQEEYKLLKNKTAFVDGDTKMITYNSL